MAAMGCAAYLIHASINICVPRHLLTSNLTAPPQVIFALPAENGTDYSMRIYNSDGSEPEMCGNGIRCLARFVAGEVGSNAAIGEAMPTKIPGINTSTMVCLVCQNVLMQMWMELRRGSTRCIR